MAIIAERRIQFCAGHRVFLHESKCANMHGHNYVAYFKAELNEVQDQLGRVVDFSVLKERIGGWIDKHWDHGFLYYCEDEVIRDLFEPGGLMASHKSYMMPENPTAENMAKYLLLRVCPALFEKTGIRIVEIRLEETENCAAIVNFPRGVGGPTSRVTG